MSFASFQILKTLAQKKRRNVPLVRKLTYHLEKRLMNLNLETFCEILHSLSQLSFKSNVSIKKLVMISSVLILSLHFLSLTNSYLEILLEVPFYIIYCWSKTPLNEWTHNVWLTNFYQGLVFLTDHPPLRKLLRGREIDRHRDFLDGHTVVTDELGSTQATTKATTQQDLPTLASKVKIWGSQSYSVRRGALCFYTYHGSCQLLSNRVTRTIRGKLESNSEVRTVEIQSNK